jgi:AP2 domain/HNH endonuclease
MDTRSKVANCRVIPLTQNKCAIVDESDFEHLSGWRWYAAEKSRGVFYAGRKVPVGGGGYREILMHRQLVGRDGREVDHKNGNTLDNRRGNLRECGRLQNLMNNGRRSDNTSGFKGVHFHSRAARWQARIKANGRRISLGLYKTSEAAAIAYDLAAKRYFGDFARTNF